MRERTYAQYVPSFNVVTREGYELLHKSFFPKPRKYATQRRTQV